LPRAPECFMLSPYLRASLLSDATSSGEFSVEYLIELPIVHYQWVTWVSEKPGDAQNTEGE
jgi:hypothetical protein